jgi:hypothetical protein
MVNESLVRVSVARYLRAARGDSAARREVAAQRARGFLWTDELFELFGEYERDRARYPTLDAFLPRVAAYFTALVPRIGGIIGQYDRPGQGRVRRPADQAAGDDPALDGSSSASTGRWALAITSTSATPAAIASEVTRVSGMIPAPRSRSP